MNNTEIENIFNELLGYNAKYDIKLKLFSPSLGSFSDKVFFFLVILVLFAIILFPIFWYFGIPWVYQLILLIVTLGYIVLLISAVIEEIQDLAQFAKNPLSRTLRLLERNCIEDVKLIENMLSCNPISVEYVCKQLTAERLAFERRVGVLVGALEKVGIIPGLATLIFCLVKNKYIAGFILLCRNCNRCAFIIYLGVSYSLPI